MKCANQICPRKVKNSGGQSFYCSRLCRLVGRGSKRGQRVANRMYREGKIQDSIDDIRKEAGLEQRKYRENQKIAVQHSIVAEGFRDSGML